MEEISTSFHQTDFQLGPISIDMIEDNLYLGGLAAAKSLDVLHERKITHILTIDICPLPRTITDTRQFVTKFIKVTDQPNEDLLAYFDETHLFIEEGLSTGAVLVHCFFGVSRSVTIVAAYLMKKYNIGYREAIKRIKQKRSIVRPNDGFKSQLKVYAKMNCTIDPTDLHYKVYRLTLAADRVRKVKILPQEFHDLIQDDPGLEQARPDPNAYRCRMCRRVLANKSHLLKHRDSNKETCKRTYFLLPMSWMNCTEAIQGKLLCPKCDAKLGSYSWTMGCECPCGKKIAPAFYLVPSKIDFTDAVQNVEVTF